MRIKFNDGRVGRGTFGDAVAPGEYEVPEGREAVAKIFIAEGLATEVGATVATETIKPRHRARAEE